MKKFRKVNIMPFLEIEPKSEIKFRGALILFICLFFTTCLNHSLIRSKASDIMIYKKMKS